MEGVGSGAIEAALRACDTDVPALSAAWSTAPHVPYAFMADTLEAIAETSKRLEICSLLVLWGVRVPT